MSSSSLMKQRLKRSTTALISPYQTFHRKTISSPTDSPCKESIPTEVKANSPITNLINFNSIHQRYNNNFLDIPQIENDTPPHFPSEKQYLNNIHRLNQEIQIMSSQLKLANETIASLTIRLNESNNQHAIHIQELHERHEQKITKIKSDIDKLVGQAHSKPSPHNLQKIIMEKNFEIEDQHKKFNEKLAEVRNRYEKQMKIKEKDNARKIELLKNQFLEVINELKGRFLGEIENLHKKYKCEMDQVKEAMKVIGNKDGGSEDEISTAIEIDHEKNAKNQDSLSDLQIIEELSSKQQIFLNPLNQCQKCDFDRRPNESENSITDLDASLRQLIGQISFDNEISLTDIFNH